MHMRMPDRLVFDVDLPVALHGRHLPSMALLTLVENAVRHGIDPAEKGGRIEVGAARDADGSLRVWVRDSGVGLAEAAQRGTGLKNLRERLAAFYGPGAVLRLGAATPQGLHAELCIPAAALSP
jgi:LytS/YehU family sensor histidine kinase